MTESIILVGFMGAGKSVVSQILGAQLGRPVHDLDHLIKAQENLEISDIFNQYGESYFRDLESRMLNDCLLNKPSSIISTGGGIVENDDNRTLLLSQPCVIWLDVDLSVVYERIGHLSGRPLMNNQEHVSERFYRRQNWYREVATFQIDCNCKSPESVAEIIKNRYG